MDDKKPSLMQQLRWLAIDLNDLMIWCGGYVVALVIVILAIVRVVTL